MNGGTEQPCGESEQLEPQDAYREIQIKRCVKNKGVVMNNGIWAVLIPILRQVFLVAGGWLVSKGYIEQGQVEALVGGLLVAAAALWKWIEMWRARRK